MNKLKTRPDLLVIFFIILLAIIIVAALVGSYAAGANLPYIKNY
jgi:hypothetical protein